MSVGLQHRVVVIAHGLSTSDPAVWSPTADLRPEDAAVWSGPGGLLTPGPGGLLAPGPRRPAGTRSRTRARTESSTSVGLHGVEELAHGVLGVTEEQRGLLLEEQLVLDAGEPRAHRALHEDDLSSLVGVEDRHP